MPLTSGRNKTEDEYWDSLYGENSPSKKRAVPTPSPELTAEPETDGNFSRGFSSGVDNMQALYGGGKALLGSGVKNLGELVGSESLVDSGDDLVADGMAYYQEKQAEAQENLPDSTFGDIDSASDFGAWAAYTLGSAVPDLAGMVVGGGLATLATKAVVKKGATEFAEKYAKEKAEALVERGVSEELAESVSKEIADKIAKDQLAAITAKAGTVGAGLYAGQQGASSTFARTLEETGEEAPVAAVVSGTLQAAINAIPVGVALTKFMPKGKSDDAVEFISGSISDKGAWFGNFLKDVTAQSGMEGATEALQYVVEEEVISYVNNNFTENEKREYFDYISNERKRAGIIEQAAGGTLFGFATGSAGASLKAATGGYDSDVNMGDGAKIIRTQSVNDPEFGARIRQMYDQAKSDAASGRTSLGEMVPSERPVDPVTGELATTWNAEGALDPETNRPYTDEQLNQARLLDFNAAEEPIDIPDGDMPEPAVSADTQNPQFGENTLPPSPQSPKADIVTDFPSAPAFGTREVPEGNRAYGHDHKFDAPMSPQDKPVQDQLVELSVAANTPEALDPNNTDVIVEAIDQDDIDRVFDRNEKLEIKFDSEERVSLPTIDESYGQEAPAVTTLTAGVMADLSANGVPTSFIDAVSGMYVHQPSDVSAPALTGNQSRGISISSELLNKAMVDSDALSELGWTMTHEVYHAADYAFDLSTGDSRFDIRIQDDADAPSVVMGDIMEEVFDNWVNGTAVGKRFDYPFNDLRNDIADADQNNGELNNTYREEVFAQLGALFHSNPEQLKSEAPLAYNYIKQIRDSNLQNAIAPEVKDEPTQSTSPADTSQPEGISGEIRAPPESGVIEGVQPATTGRDSEASPDSQPADTGMAGSQQDETGQRQRQAVQEPEVEPATSIEAADPDRTPVVLKATDKKPTFKKAENYEETGNYIVTFADGDRYTLYFDDDAKEAGDEVYFTSEDGKIDALDGMLGETQQETIDELIAHRQKLIDAGENSYNLPLDPQVGGEIEFKAWSFIDEKGAVTEKQLRAKFKSLEDNQFENLKQRLLDENREEEDTVILQDGKFMSYEYLQEKDLDSLQDLFDDPSFIKKGAEYLLQTSEGDVREKTAKGKPNSAITKVISPKNADAQLPLLKELVDRHPSALDSVDSWLAFERDLTGSNETLRPPHGLIALYNDIDLWAKTHSRLTKEQIEAADRGLQTAYKMGELYGSGNALPEHTSKLMLWGMLSRMLTASSQEAAFVDLLTKNNAVSELSEKALQGNVTQDDLAEWRNKVPNLIPQGSFGKGGTSNANAFGSLMIKLSEVDEQGVSKLQKLHNLIEDRSTPTSEVRRQFQGMLKNAGIDNKVFSFLMLMTGRDDVVILDRIQLNTMWDSGRYGKLIYDDIADEFNGLHGVARYEVMEKSLALKVGQLYEAIGRPEDASVGRYHWESWVLNSGQVVAHPTMQGIVKDMEGNADPYAFMGAPEGKQNTFAYGAIYARDEAGEPYFIYNDSKSEPYRLSRSEFRNFLNEIKKPKAGVLPKNFKVSTYDKGFPWYEAEGVNRERLDEILKENAGRKATQREYAFEGAVQSQPDTDVSRQELDSPPEKVSFVKKKINNAKNKTLDDGSPSTNAFSYNDEIDGQADLSRRLKNRPIYKSLVDKYAQQEDFEAQAAGYLGVGRLPAELSPRDQENLAHGKVQNALNDFHENFVDPLGDLIAELKADPDAIGTYLIAKHAAERNDVIAGKVREQRGRNIARTEKQIESLLDDVESDHTVQLENLALKLKGYKEDPLLFQDTGSGMTYDEAQSVLNLAEREGTKADMERIASKVYDMLKHQREIMVSSGLMDADSVADWEATYEFYVPLKGFAAEPEGDTYKRTSKANGFSVVGSESMKAKGRKTLPVNPLFTAIEDVQMKIIRAQKNQTAQTFLDLLSKLGNSDSYTIYNNKFRPPKESDHLTMQDLDQMARDTRVNGDPKYVQVKKGGQTFFIHFKSDTLNHALQDMSVAALDRNNTLMDKALTFATRFQTFRRNMLINYNPSWGLVNPMRDVQTGLMYALGEKDKKGSRVQGENLIGKMAQSYLPSMRAMYRTLRGKPVINEMGKYAAEFMEDGASTGLMLVRDQAEQLRILKNKLKRGYTREALTAIGNWVEDFNSTMENAVRLAAYTEARKAGTDRQTAATLAKDLTVNFNRKGENTAQVNAGYLFFNAAVQGNLNIAQALGSDKGNFTAARGTAAGLVVLGTTMAVMNILSSEEDEDGEKNYADLPEHAKNRSLLFMYNDQEGFALPAPYGYNFFTNIGRLSAEMVFGINTPEESAQYLAENVLLNFVPIAPSSGDNWEEMARGFYPDLLEVHLDMLANKNFFGSDIYIEQNSFMIERSNAYNSRRSTDKAFTSTAKFLNDATGGDKYEDGVLSFNPDKMQYAYEYFLGGVGRFVSQTGDVAARMMADEEFRKQDLPIIGTFYESPSEYEDRFEFYANWEESRKVEARLKEASTEEELVGLRQKYQSFIPVLDGGRNSPYKTANRELRKISKTRKIVETQNISEERRREMLKKLLDAENKIFDLYNKMYRKAEKGIRD